MWALKALFPAGEASPNTPLPCPPMGIARTIWGRGRKGKVKAGLRRGVGGWGLERCRRRRGLTELGPAGLRLEERVELREEEPARARQVGSFLELSGGCAGGGIGFRPHV